MTSPRHYPTAGSEAPSPRARPRVSTKTSSEARYVLGGARPLRACLGRAYGRQQPQVLATFSSFLSLQQQAMLPQTAATRKTTAKIPMAGRK